MPSDVLFNNSMADLSPDMKKLMNIMRMTRKVDFIVKDLEHESGVSHENDGYVEQKGECCTNHFQGLDCRTNFCSSGCTSAINKCLCNYRIFNERIRSREGNRTGPSRITRTTIRTNLHSCLIFRNGNLWNKAKRRFIFRFNRYMTKREEDKFFANLKEASTKKINSR